MQDAANIFNTLKHIINKARAESVTTIQASNRVAEERIEAIARVKRMFVPK
jgi:uncharacterized protein YdbL (DUF1318 family)